ncbi:UDP-N-acetylglucosamine 4,6-dehydratase (inverting) [Prosthecobacter fusiformis]|uniref:UDP-N-acetylglucosamine 4,6-dehydratase (Inverting) n=1 Tax=Prosthecobacter fusiformis TaxID=48464 RepID=A0A4R7RXQ5_9BACT|nr:UDP-N-acetylglucosamine 4,6-dehydratase (inverting) [Prosthecobacter fusiformis]TDU70674.1 UDP-N-acetylglucosamine 4,6-dehydratase (inverting) [Prosthecobacter fusiformis]
MSSARSILVTGGTGSFGQKCIRTLLADPSIKRIVIYSRDELKQYEMSQKFTDSRLRFFLGDIRDRNRLCRALERIDTVIHAAALKQVPAAEYNPMEFIKTNVLGAENLIEACLDAEVKNVVALSTDKAAAPINLYGATKLCSDKLFIAANNVKGSRDIRFSVVRYGNVMGSRGSVIPFFLDRRKTGVLPITDPAMTRFNITLEEGVALVQHALEKALGGEIFVPKIPSYRITDVAEAIGPDCVKPIVGIRPGEKIHEEMVTSTDAMQTIMTDRYYIIFPSSNQGLEATKKRFCDHHNGTSVPPDFAYNSGTNSEWMTVPEIRALIREHVDPSFDLT